MEQRILKSATEQCLLQLKFLLKEERIAWALYFLDDKT